MSLLMTKPWLTIIISRDFFFDCQFFKKCDFKLTVVKVKKEGLEFQHTKFFAYTTLENSQVYSECVLCDTNKKNNK